MRQFLKNNSLSIALLSLFAVFLAGLAFAGYHYQNEQLQAHGQSGESFGHFLVSPPFLEAIFENWESEFLQMGALVVLTIWLFQKGAADSRKLRGKEPFDTSSRYSIIRASSWTKRGKALGDLLYSNSLSIALFGLFLFSFAIHVVSGAAAVNEEAVAHGVAQRSLLEYAGSAQFWFESFQNWQSEFLSVGVLLILSVFLRQRYSPESKPVGATNEKTG